jgi:hypothetical protein
MTVKKSFRIVLENINIFMPVKQRKRKNKKVKTADLLPQSREFLLEQKLEKEKNKKIREMVVLLENEKRKEERLVKIAEEDVHKRFLMWSGVACFMVLIFVFWIFNLKKVFSQTENRSQAEISLDKITGDFKKTVSEVKNNIVELKGALETATSTAEKIRPTFPIATSSEERIAGED